MIEYKKNFSCKVVKKIQKLLKQFNSIYFSFDDITIHEKVTIFYVLYFIYIYILIFDTDVCTI